MKNIFKQLLTSGLITALLLPVLVSCAENGNAGKVSESDIQQQTTAGETEPEETHDTRFDGVDFGGKEFRVLSSSDSFDSTNAHALIAGTGTQTGDIVNDAVYLRNENVSKLLNVELKFTESDFTYSTAKNEINKIIMSNEDLYDVIINDILALAPLSSEGMFMNVANAKNFDYSQKYWYDDWMNDLVLVNGHKYVLAGDWFMDIISSCHTLFHNKDKVNAIFGDKDYIYKMVNGGTWTYDNLVKICEESYADLDGNGKTNEGDFMGLTVYGTWGSAIPFIVSAGIEYLDRSSGTPVFDFNNERSVALLEKLNRVFWNKGALSKIKVDSGSESQAIRNLFGSEKSLIIGYSRLGDLAKLRDITFDIGVTPYPMIEEEGKYITSLHDTTEVGAIPVTTPDLDFVTTVIEVLNRETSTSLMPTYYEDALKVKYTTDTISASMIDIIHDNFGSAFPLAFNNSLNSFCLNIFADPLGLKKIDFASGYDKKYKKASQLLEEMIEKISELPA